MQLTLAIAVAASLLSFTSANQFSKTCTNITLSTTGNLTAECRDKKQVPKQASLNLNSLIGYSAGKFQWSSANYLSSCTSCSIYLAPNAIYTFVNDEWMTCLCGNTTYTQNQKTDVDLDDYIDNDDGNLKRG
ncbi:Cyanovirin-N [Halenospora varia]|nr:Cyanovirin-N [Halenospora varia]